MSAHLRGPAWLRRGVIAPLGLSALVAAGACAISTDTERFAGERGSLEIISTSPGVEENVDSRRVHVDFCLNARVDPASVRPEDLRIRSGVVFYDAAVEVELLNWRERGATPASEAPWCEGSVIRISPRSQLAPGINYRVIMYDGPRGWRGERFDLEAPGWLVPEPADTEGSSDPRFDEARFVLTFAIDPEAPELDEPDPPPPTSLAELFVPGAVFDTQGVCSCHADTGDPARDLLDLSDPERAYQALVLDPRVSDSGARRVAPGSPAQSYVVHKVARDDEGNTMHAVPGAPMPPEAALSHAHLAQLSAWINEGAAP